MLTWMEPEHLHVIQSLSQLRSFHLGAGSLATEHEALWRTMSMLPAIVIG